MIKNKIITIILICTFFVIHTINNFHIHADEVSCPYCGSTNVVLLSSSATCTEDGIASYRCLNTEAPEHSAIFAAPQPTDFRISQPALGHDLVTSIKKQATCIEEGLIVHQCSRCSYSESVKIPLTNHKYNKTVVKEATCLQNGTIEYVCKYCNEKYSETIKAFGHNFVEKEKKEVTCEEDGYILKVCKNCKEEEKTILEAIGHDVVFSIVKEPTCTQEGLQSGICKNCNEEIRETIKTIGHHYPNEWTIESDATIFSEGLKTKTCANCNERIEEVIEKKPIPTSVYIGGSALVTTIGAAIFALKKYVAKKVTKDLAKDVIEKQLSQAENELLKPSFEERTIVTSIEENSFYKILKSQKNLKVIESEFDTLKETIEENEPSLTIIDYSDKNLEDSIDYLNTLKEELDSPLISILVNSEQIEKQSELLNQLKQDEIIKEFINIKTNSSVILVKLVLPVMKPDLKSDAALENISMVADALNIPGVSTIIDTFITTREIKTTYDDGKEEGLSFADKSLIISDIASILHLDNVSSVTGLVGDLDDIKSSLESKIGANEISTIKDAASDIVDVVSDIVNN